MAAPSRAQRSRRRPKCRRAKYLEFDDSPCRCLQPFVDWGQGWVHVCCGSPNATTASNQRGQSNLPTSELGGGVAILRCAFNDFERFSVNEVSGVIGEFANNISGRLLGERQCALTGKPRLQQTRRLASILTLPLPISDVLIYRLNLTWHLRDQWIHRTA